MARSEHHSALAAPASTVWAWATTSAGVNDEMLPLLRMTTPAGWLGTSIADVRPGTHLGRSWLLAFGVLPVDWDDLTIAEVEAAPGGYRFLERSRLLSAPVWEHERTVADRASGDGCDVRDRLTFSSRALVRHLPMGERGHTAVVDRIFAHRHRRLRQRFGTV
jgi:ligand-binding SRPBCC domain-containing protein